MRFKYRIGDWVIYNNPYSKLHNLPAKVHAICRRTSSGHLIYLIDFGKFISQKQHNGGSQELIEGVNKLKSKTGIYANQERLAPYMDVTKYIKIFAMQNAVKKSDGIKFKLLFLGLLPDLTMVNISIQMARLLRFRYNYGAVYSRKMEEVEDRLSRLLSRQKTVVPYQIVWDHRGEYGLKVTKEDELKFKSIVDERPELILNDWSVKYRERKEKKEAKEKKDAEESSKTEQQPL